MSNWFWIGPILAALLTALGYIFVKYLQGEFNPGLTLQYGQKRVSISPNQSLIFIEVEARNTSRVPVNIGYIEVTLRRLARYTDEEVRNLNLESTPPGSSLFEPIRWEQIFTIARPWEKGSCTVQPGECHYESFDFVIPSAYDTIPVQVDIQYVSSPLADDMTFNESATAWRRVGIIEPNQTEEAE